MEIHDLPRGQHQRLSLTMTLWVTSQGCAFPTCPGLCVISLTEGRMGPAVTAKGPRSEMWREGSKEAGMLGKTNCYTGFQRVLDKMLLNPTICDSNFSFGGTLTHPTLAFKNSQILQTPAWKHPSFPLSFVALSPTETQSRDSRSMQRH